MVICLIPVVGKTEEAHATETETMWFGADKLKENFNTANAATVWYGYTETNTEKEKYKWRVVGYNGESNSTNALSVTGKMTLIADGTIETGVVFNSNEKSGKTDSKYSGSYLQTRVDAIAEQLTDNEKKAVAKRTLTGNSDRGTAFDNMDIIWGNPVSDTLMWPLSVKEAGYYGPGLNISLRALNLEWWLRSPGNHDDWAAVVDHVVHDGDVCYDGYDVRNTFGVRPAFYINLSSIIFTSLIPGTSETTGAEYKLTVKDESISTVIGNGGVSRNGNTVTVPVNVTGTHNRVSVVMTDGIWINNGWSDGASLKYYGELDADNSFVLPDDYNILWNTYILAEQINGGKETDYAGTPVLITVPWKKTTDTLSLGTSGIGNPTRPTSSSDAWKGSYVYFGAYDGRYGTSGVGDKIPVKYRVLQNDTTRFSEEAADGSKAHTMFLDCDNVLYKQAFDDNYIANPGATGSYSNEWYYSDIAGHVARDTGTHHNSIPGLNDAEGGGFIATGFTEDENAAIAESTIATHALVSSGEDGVLVADWTKREYGNYVALNHEKLFLLDAEDASNPEYGYIKSDTDNTCRVKDFISSESNGETAYWWLRSAYYRLSNVAGNVTISGNLNYSDDRYGVTHSGVGVSPAFNINLSSVLFSSLIKEAVNGTGAEYKLTVNDADRTLSVPADENIIRKSTNEITVPYTIDNGSDHVSLLITNKNDTWSPTTGWSANAVKQYYQTVAVTSGASVTFTLPDNYDANRDNWQVWVLPEKINGAKETDYAGEPVEITVPYLIVFDHGEGSGTMVPKSAMVGDTFTFPECTFIAQSGRAFDNWKMSGANGSYSPGATIKITTDCIKNGVITVTAHWKEHSHNYTYSASGETITASCSGEGTCDIKTGLNLKINAPDAEKLTYDGKAKAVTINSDYNTTAFPDAYPISYYEGTSVLSGAPVNAGIYKATVTVGTETAEVSYEIKEAEIVVSGIKAVDKIYNGNDTAELDYSSINLKGVLDSDREKLVVTAKGKFTDSNAGKEKIVTIYDLQLTGDATANYKLAASGQQTETTAEIFKLDSKIKKVPVARTGLVYTGDNLELITNGTAENGTMVYAVTEKGTAAPADDKYSANIPVAVNAGEYKVYYKVIGDTNYNDVAIANIDVAIKRASQEAPKLTSTDETVSGKNDGIITGLTTAMEISTEGADKGFSAVTDISGNGLAPGTYYVRFAEDKNHEISPVTMITINYGAKPVTPTIEPVKEQKQYPYLIKTVVNNADGSITTTTTTYFEDGSITELVEREWVKGKKKGRKNTKETVMDPEGQTLSQIMETISFSRKQTKTETKDIKKADGYSFSSTVKTYKSGKQITKVSKTFENGLKQEYTETKNPDGTKTRKVMDTNAKGKSTITVTTVVWGEADSAGTSDNNGSSVTETKKKLIKTVTKYKVTGDGKIRLTSLKTEGDTAIIPKSISFDGKKYMVVSLGKKLFKKAEGIKEIYIYAENLKKIYAGAFDGVPADAKFYIKATTTNCKKIVRMIKKSGFGKVDYTKI